MSTSTTDGGAPPARRRNPRGEGERLKGEISDTALALLDETGDAGAVTLRAVARRVGISAPSIYGHFENRQQILLAALTRAFTEIDAELRRVVEGAGPNSRDRLLVLCEAYLDFARVRPHRYLVMYGGVWNAAQDMADDAVPRDEVAALGIATLELLQELLTACVADGSSQSTDPDADAIALWVAMHGLAHQRIVSTAFTWPPDIDSRLVARMAYI